MGAFETDLILVRLLLFVLFFAVFNAEFLTFRKGVNRLAVLLLLLIIEDKDILEFLFLR